MSAAAVLAQHRKLWSDTIAGCSGCDWSKFGNITWTDLAHAAHQLDALKAAGYVVVELPKRCDKGWHVDADDDFHVTRVHLVDERSGEGLTGARISWGAIELNLSPAHTAGLAAALLAAIDAAEVTA